jgi:hypothetical protein
MTRGISLIFCYKLKASRDNLLMYRKRLPRGLRDDLQHYSRAHCPFTARVPDNVVLPYVNLRKPGSFSVHYYIDAHKRATIGNIGAWSSITSSVAIDPFIIVWTSDESIGVIYPQMRCHDGVITVGADRCNMITYRLNPCGRLKHYGEQCDCAPCVEYKRGVRQNFVAKKSKQYLVDLIKPGEFREGSYSVAFFRMDPEAYMPTFIVVPQSLIPEQEFQLRPSS